MSATHEDHHATAADAGVVVDLSSPRRVHVIGVGGAAMRAIASVLVRMGHTVSGSDLRDSAALDRLRLEGVDVEVGHDADHLAGDVDVVAVSTAIREHNPELRAARALGIPVASRAAFLAAIAAQRRTIAVAGTHGKTTTSSMLALVLREAGMQPSFIIGGEVTALRTGAMWDDGEWFVVEADESDGTFLTVPRQAAIVTNVEPDHMEHWGDFDALRASFAQFLATTDGPAVVCADDPVAAELARATGAVTYGTAAEARFRVVFGERSRSGIAFTLFDGTTELGVVHLPLPGEHNARNAAAAVVTGVLLGAPFDAAARAMAGFAGVARRFQRRGAVAGITFVDDYAHLPTEVGAALAAARDGSWDRIVCVFQPHRYSRTASLWHSFTDAFARADVLVVTDIYASGEAPRPGVSGKLIVDAVFDGRRRPRVVYLPHRADLVAFLRHELRAGDLCLTLGAGDLTTLPEELLSVLTDKGAVARRDEVAP